MQDTIELLAEADGETTRLLSPGVGTFTCAVSPGGYSVPGRTRGS